MYFLRKFGRYWREIIAALAATTLVIAIWTVSREPASIGENVLDKDWVSPSSSPQVENEDSIPSFVKTEDRIKMYFKYGDRFVEYQLVKTNNSEINASGWRIGQCFLCKDNGTKYN